MPKLEVHWLPGEPPSKSELSSPVTIHQLLSEHNLHGNVLVKVNGREVPESYDIDSELLADDFIQIFDQPRGGGFKGALNPFKNASKLSNILLRPGFAEFGASLKFAKKAIGTVMGGLIGGAGVPSTATGDSPNNDLSQQTNRARLYKGRPNIYGQVRAYPDLIQESLLQYIDGVQYATEFMELGYGFYGVTSVRFSESTLASMDGAKYTIYQPGENIPVMEQGYSFDDVSDQEVQGTDKASTDIVQKSISNDMQEATISGGEMKIVITEDNDFDYFNDSAKPLGITAIVNVTYNTASGSVTKDVTMSANIFKSDTVDVTDATTGIVTGHNMEFYLNNLSGSDINNIPADATVNKTSVTFIRYESIKEGPFFAPFASDQLWINVYASLADEKNADGLVTYWLVDDENNQIDGTQRTMTFRLEENKEDTSLAYQTLRITGMNGRFAFTVERTDNAGSSTMYVKSANAITVRNNVTYPNDTIIRIDAKQTDSQSNAERKYNCLATRHVIGYSRATGQVDYTLRESRSFADAVLHEWVSMSKQPVERLDLVSLYSIADSLSDPQLGYFDYTFSDANQSLGERLQIICDAANVSFNWIGDQLVFWRDEKVDYPAAVFSRSNMFWDEFKRSYSLSLKGGYDGVSVTYTDPVTNKSAYIYLSVSDAGIVESSDETSNSNKTTLNGCRNATQARDRAYQEARSMIYSRTTMTVKVLESVPVVRGVVVQCPDMYDNDQQTGYLKGRDGNIFYTSERIKFSSEQMYVVMTDSDGKYRGRWECNAVPGNANAFTASADQFAINIYNGSTIQSPSRYFIASNDEINSTLWRVSSAKPNGDDTQTLTLTEYSPSIYSN